MKQQIYTPAVRSTLKTLGRNIHIARRKRRQSQQDFADRMGVSLGTLKRLEKGEPGISIGTLSMAFLALGELERLSDVLDVAADDAGLLMDQDTLPKRIRKPKKKSKPGPENPNTIDPKGMTL